MSSCPPAHRPPAQKGACLLRDGGEEVVGDAVGRLGPRVRHHGRHRVEQAHPLDAGGAAGQRQRARHALGQRGQRLVRRVARCGGGCRGVGGGGRARVSGSSQVGAGRERKWWGAVRVRCRRRAPSMERCAACSSGASWGHVALLPARRNARTHNRCAPIPSPFHMSSRIARCSRSVGAECVGWRTVRVLVLLLAGPDVHGGRALAPQVGPQARQHALQRLQRAVVARGARPRLVRLRARTVWGGSRTVVSRRDAR